MGEETHHRILQLAVLLKVLPELIIGQLPGAAHKQLVRWLLAAAATAASAATPTATALIGAGHGALGLDALAVDDVVLVLRCHVTNTNSQRLQQVIKRSP